MLSLKSLFQERLANHSSLKVPKNWPRELEVQVAKREPDLERAFRLLHDAYVREGLSDVHPSGLRVLPQHLLPQSTTLVALWDKRVIGAATLIRENAFKLPIETHVSLAELKQGGCKIAELSLFALDPMDEELHPELVLPLFRYIYHYATRCFGIQKLVLTLSPTSDTVYRNTFKFRPISESRCAFFLDLQKAPESWRGSELGDYLQAPPEHAGFKLPPPVYGVSPDFIMTPELMERLFLKKAGLMRNLHPDAVHALFNSYPQEKFRPLLESVTWTGSHSGAKFVEKEPRVDAQLSGRIVERDPTRDLDGFAAVKIRNISRHGLQIWSSIPLAQDEILVVDVDLNENERTRLRVQVKWLDAGGISGLRILNYSSEWGKVIQTIEDVLSRSSAAA